jgi:hypothetical protein
MLEVRTIIIKATVVGEKDGESAGDGSEGSNNDVSPNEQLITSCVEKILEILKDKNDR